MPCYFLNQATWQVRNEVTFQPHVELDWHILFRLGFLFVCFYKEVFNYYLFIYFWLCWVFVSVLGLSLVAASRGHSSSRCTGLSLLRPLLWSTGSRRAGSVIVAHGSSCSAACGIFPDQGSNPCPLHWQADSQPLRHQRSPDQVLIETKPHESLNFQNCYFCLFLKWLESNYKCVLKPGKFQEIYLCVL